jgi:Ca2+-binding RTX toxin-like protein
MATITGGAGNDTLSGADEDDLIRGLEGADTLRGMGGNDILEGGAGNDLLVGGEGDDTLRGGDGINTIEGGAGSDLYRLDGSANSFDAVDLGAGLDRVEIATGFGGVLEFNVDLVGNGAADRVRLTVFGGSGATLDDEGTVFSTTLSEDRALRVNTISGYFQTVALGSTDADTFEGTSAGDYQAGGAGNDTLRGASGADFLFGGGDADQLEGGEGDDQLNGGLGDDVLVGAAGNDTIIGGGGSDRISGGEGNDILQLMPTSLSPAPVLTGTAVDGGGGYDKLSVSGLSTLDLESGAGTIGAAAFTVTGVEELAVFGIEASATARVLGDSSANRFTANTGGRVEFDGRGGDDTLIGSFGRDTLSGGSGDDNLQGDHADDILKGGDGDDLLSGGFGSDTLDGGAGVDTAVFFFNDSGAVTFDASSFVPGQDQQLADGRGGRDTLSGIERISIIGSGGSDRLIGSSSDDTISSSGGNDTIVGGGGNDVIIHRGGSANIDAGTGDDLIKIDELVGFSALTSTSVNGGEGLDRLTLEFRPFGYGPDSTTTVVVNGTTVTARATSTVFAGGPTINGVNIEAVTVMSGGGNDTLTGGGGDDVLYGDFGNDIINGGAGRDLVSGGYGDDVLDGGTGGERAPTATQNGGDLLSFATVREFEVGAEVIVDLAVSVAQDTGLGRDTIRGFEDVLGSNFNDVIRGDDGANRLEGGAGADQLFGRGGDDVLVAGAGAAANGAPDVPKSQAVSNGSLASAVTLAGSFDLGPDPRIESSTTIPHTTVRGVASGTSTEEFYAFTVTGEGRRVTADVDGTSGFWSTLRLYDSSGRALSFDAGSGFDPGSMSERDGFLRTTLNAGTYYVAVGDQTGFLVAGSTYTLHVSVEGAPVVPLTPGRGSLLDGGAGDDLLLGGAAADELQGGSGLDIIRGGAGDDVAFGQDGDDQLYGERGNDTLFGEAGNDRIHGGDGDDVVNGLADNDLVEGGAGNDRVFGGAGDDVLGGQDGNDLLEGGAGNDNQFGDAGDDTLGGQDGDDTLLGQAGRDNLFGDGGNDRLFGGTENDSFRARLETID